MKTPVTARKCAFKTFYVFFAFGGKYSGQYAEIQARSLEKAEYEAWTRFGITNVRSILADKAQAESRIKAFELKRNI